MPLIRISWTFPPRCVRRSHPGRPTLPPRSLRRHSRPRKMPPLQPLGMIIRAFDASIMLQLSNLRIPGIHIGADFRFQRIPVVATRPSLADLMSRSTFWIAAVAAACACSLRATTLSCASFWAAADSIFGFLGGRTNRRVVGKRFDHGTPPKTSGPSLYWVASPAELVGGFCSWVRPQLKAPPLANVSLCPFAVTIKTSEGPRRRPAALAPADELTQSAGQTRVFRRVAGFRSSSSCASTRLEVRSGWDFSRFRGPTFHKVS